MQWRLQLAGALLLGFGVAACTVVGHERVAGWPELQIVEHYVPHAEMRERCGKYTAFGMSPEACAEFDLAQRRCHLWFSADFPPQAWIVEHERLHCRGYDHVGMGTMRGLLARHRAADDDYAGAGATRPAASP